MAVTNHVDTVELTAIPYEASSHLDLFPFAQNNLELKVAIDYAVNKMILDLKTFILAEEDECGHKDITIEYEVPVIPKELIEMFPNFHLDQLPTERHTITKRVSVKKRILYPQANAKIPELGEMSRIKFVAEECYNER